MVKELTKEEIDKVNQELEEDLFPNLRAMIARWLQMKLQAIEDAKPEVKKVVSRDDDLKDQLVRKLLYHEIYQHGDYYYYGTAEEVPTPDIADLVSNADWLSICHKLEEEVSPSKYPRYLEYLYGQVLQDPGMLDLYHKQPLSTNQLAVRATWQMRAAALIKLHDLWPATLAPAVQT